MKLHPAQEKLLKILKLTNSDPLSIRELQQEIGASSPSVVQHHLKQLEKKGFLRKNPSNPQDYQILREPDDDVVYINMYGMAQCGPNGQLLDGNPVDTIAVYSPLMGFPASEAFAIKARGKSMEPEINPNDIIIAKKANTTQDNAIAVCVNNGETLIKRIQKIQTNGGVAYNLISSNPDFPPFLASDDFHIEGVVKQIIKNAN